MQKIKLTEEYLKAEIASCQKSISELQDKIQQHVGVISHCEWVLKNIELTESGTAVVEVPLKTEERQPIVLA